MKKVLILSLFFLLANNLLLNAQHLEEKGLCGTDEGRVKWLDTYLQNPADFPESDDTVYIPLQVHLVGNDNGTGFFSTRNLLDAFCTLQRDYKSAGIQFYLLDVNYIANSTYYNHNRETGKEMMSIYKVEGALNCYIPNSPGAGLCGYSDYNLGVTMAKGCVSASDHTWAHEIGHFLSLPHPFLGWEGNTHNYNLPAPVQWGDNIVERADSIFCNIAADGFCDTEPDYLNFRWPCDTAGLSLQEQTDPAGNKFLSDGSLIMSYAYDNCVNRFSYEQGKAMVANLLSEKQDYFDIPYVPLGHVEEQPLSPLSPSDGELIATYDQVYFEWEPIPNATHYELQITNFEPFSYILKSYIVEGNSTIVSDLVADEEYWWRIRPFNMQDACTSVTDKAGFVTGNATTVNTLDILYSGTVYPNPLRGGEEAVLSITSAGSFSCKLILTDVSGQLIMENPCQVFEGENTIPLTFTNVEPGMYFLSIQGETGIYSQKILIR